MRTALYIGGNRQPERLFKTAISCAHSRPSEWLLISRQAVENAPGDILGMTWKNLVHHDRPSEPPFIYVRDPIHANAYKLYMDKKEIAGLAAFFGFPAEVASGGIFNLLNYRLYKSNSLSLAPRWEELTDPIWRKAFLGWVAREQGLPEISQIERWTLFSNEKITLPGIADAALIHNGTRIKTGRLVFFEQQGERRAFFDRGGGRRSVYSLSLDRETGRDRIELLGACQPSKKEDFDRIALAALLGSRPTSTVYLCSKRAGKEGLALGNMGGLRFVIESGKVRYEKGKLYFLRFERMGSFLRIECFKDPAREQLHGSIDMELLEGLPGQSVICLEQKRSA